MTLVFSKTHSRPHLIAFSRPASISFFRQVSLLSRIMQAVSMPNVRGTLFQLVNVRVLVKLAHLDSCKILVHILSPFVVEFCLEGR